MLPKAYTLIWLMVITAAAGLFVTDNFNEMTLSILGFIVLTLFFGFFIAVLPWLMDKHFTWKY